MQWTILSQNRRYHDDETSDKPGSPAGIWSVENKKTSHQWINYDSMIHHDFLHLKITWSTRQLGFASGCKDVPSTFRETTSQPSSGHNRFLASPCLPKIRHSHHIPSPRGLCQQPMAVDASASVLGTSFTHYMYNKPGKQSHLIDFLALPGIAERLSARFLTTILGAPYPWFLYIYIYYREETWRKSR